jgi:hypothetical protein
MSLFFTAPGSIMRLCFLPPNVGMKSAGVNGVDLFLVSRFTLAISEATMPLRKKAASAPKGSQA